MMTWSSAIFIGLVAALLAGPAARAEGRWYGSASIGAEFRQDATNSHEHFFRLGRPTPPAAPKAVVVVPIPVVPGPPVGPITATGVIRSSFKPGFIADLALGYHLTRNVRLEGELGYFQYRGSAVFPFTANLNFPALDGQRYSRQSGDGFSRTTGSLNLFYDFRPIAVRFTPFVGVGDGASYNRKAAGQFVNSSGRTFFSQGNVYTADIGSLFAGVNISAGGGWWIVPTYRYIHIFRTAADDDHVLALGVRRQF